MVCKTKYKIVWRVDESKTVPRYRGRYFCSKEQAQKIVRRNIGGKKMIVVAV